MLPTASSITITPSNNVFSSSSTITKLMSKTATTLISDQLTNTDEIEAVSPFGQAYLDTYYFVLSRDILSHTFLSFVYFVSVAISFKDWTVLGLLRSEQKNGTCSKVGH